MIVAAPVVVAEKVKEQKPPKVRKGVNGQGDGVNVPVTPVTVNVTVPVGADAPRWCRPLSAFSRCGATGSTDVPGGLAPPIQTRTLPSSRSVAV